MVLQLHVSMYVYWLGEWLATTVGSLGESLTLAGHKASLLAGIRTCCLWKLLSHEIWVAHLYGICHHSGLHITHLYSRRFIVSMLRLFSHG